MFAPLTTYIHGFCCCCFEYHNTKSMQKKKRRKLDLRMFFIKLGLICGRLTEISPKRSECLYGSLVLASSFGVCMSARWLHNLFVSNVHIFIAMLTEKCSVSEYIRITKNEMQKKLSRRLISSRKRLRNIIQFTILREFCIRKKHFIINAKIRSMKFMNFNWMSTIVLLKYCLQRFFLFWWLFVVHLALVPLLSFCFCSWKCSQRSTMWLNQNTHTSPVNNQIKKLQTIWLHQKSTVTTL